MGTCILPRALPSTSPEFLQREATLGGYMKGFLNLVGMSVGGWFGWVLGSQISFLTAFIVSVVGTGVGLYFTQRTLKRFLP